MTSDPEGSGMACITGSTQFTFIICNVLKERKFKLWIHAFFDIADFDTHQGTCTCMCIHKTLLGEIYSLLIFNM